MSEPSVNVWEDAYLRFETPAQELEKFTRRLAGLGAGGWPKGGVVLELFCGRCNGVRAWKQLGFDRVVALDWSHALLQAAGRMSPPVVSGRCAADARRLPLADACVDIVCVQGGLHHLTLMDDLTRTLGEMRRVLRPGGRLVMVEPWLTPFLSCVHAACRSPLRKIWGKLDALATMIDNERTTYFDWLNRPGEVMAEIEKVAHVEHKEIGFGKLMLVATPRSTA